MWCCSVSYTEHKNGLESGAARWTPEWEVDPSDLLNADHPVSSPVTEVATLQQGPRSGPTRLCR